MYFNFLNRGNKMQFLISQILLPFIVGTGIIALIKQPLLNFLEVFSEGSMLLIICPAIIYARYSQELFFDEEPREIKVNWRWIVASLLMLILFRVYFGIGVRL
jgi:predicted Na+-dependent transporter